MLARSPECQFVTAALTNVPSGSGKNSIHRGGERQLDSKYSLKIEGVRDTWKLPCGDWGKWKFKDSIKCFSLRGQEGTIPTQPQMSPDNFQQLREPQL